MGLLDKKYKVDCEHSDSLLTSSKKETIEVNAINEEDAERKAKAILKSEHKYVSVNGISEKHPYIANSNSNSIYSILGNKMFTFWQFIAFIVSFVFVPALGIGVIAFLPDAINETERDIVWIIYDLVPSIMLVLLFMSSLILTILFHILWIKRCKKEIKQRK